MKNNKPDFDLWLNRINKFEGFKSTNNNTLQKFCKLAKAQIAHLQTT